MKRKFDFDSFREVGDALIRNKSRSLLTGFGIFWGLFMLLFLVGGGDGFQELIRNEFSGFASNPAIIIPNNTSKPYKGLQEGRMWSLRTKDVERLQALLPQADIVTPMIGEWTNVLNGTYSYDASIKGLTPDYEKIETTRLKYGRYISQTDVDKERKVCVIGERVYNELFPEGGNPCGKFISIYSTMFQVIGVDFASSNLTINGSTSQTVVIPVTVAAKLLNRGDVIDIVCLTAKPGFKISRLEQRIREIIAREHLFDPKDTEAVMLLDTEQIFSIVDNLFRGLEILIWFIGLGTLLAGAIGVSNIMMVTVKERTTEIGIRRAIGAMPRDILMQIVKESVTLTLVAGSAGIVFSVLILELIEISNEHQVIFQVSFWTAVLTALLLTALGVAAGLAPALRAMKIKPVDAMRDE